MAANFSYFTLILTFFRNIAKAMLLKKGFIRTKKLKFSLQNKKFKLLHFKNIDFKVVIFFKIVVFAL